MYISVNCRSWLSWWAFGHQASWSLQWRFISGTFQELPGKSEGLFVL